MSENGLWTVEFLSSANLVGSGVLVLNNPRLLGGDEGFYYAGSYTTHGNEISAKMDVTRFNPNSLTVFGTSDSHFSLEFSGTLQERSFEGNATVPGRNDLKIRIIGKKKEEL